MKTKEAIEWLKDAEEIAELKKYWINKVIELLKQGEKFEEEWKKLVDLNSKFWQMWEGFKKENQYAQLDRKYPNESIGLEMLMNEYEQKYFPKPSDNFTEKVMDKINNEGGR